MKNKSSSVRSRRSRKKEELKVVYISSPMKLKTSASRFRALVQELTGRDSDVSNSRFSHMVDGGCSEFVHEDHVSAVAMREEDRIRESPASSESLLDQDVFGSKREREKMRTTRAQKREDENNSGAMKEKIPYSFLIAAS
ncbi:hypothetical protein RJ639_027426 [Escallonia herrerae]|uniref:VQ domain-containing protein n=1 Tax=Escallonia herrerae TaxID=1293975 RepID=A0AA89BPA4_9ASTE|nr:hypothetical protein RJ639_027426 [Escallonia herrerae]